MQFWQVGNPPHPLPTTPSHTLTHPTPARRRYEDGYTGKEPQIAWFWDAVDSFTDAQRRMLLQFWSGSDGQPADGFGSLDPPFHMVRAGLRVGVRVRIRAPTPPAWCVRA